MCQAGVPTTYGWSTNNPEGARVFAQGVHCTAIQHVLNLTYDAPQILAICEEHDQASVNRTPLGMGMLTGKFRLDSTFPIDDVRHGWDLRAIFGAAAFRDSLPTSDIDFHVILRDQLTDLEKLEINALHEELARKYPPLGGELDGYYILLENAKKSTPPQSEMWQHATDHAWALHREHIRAGRYIKLNGGDPREIYPPSTWPEMEEALWDELRYIEQHLVQYPDYCILNLCRLLYSFQTRNVVISKAKASEWSLKALPGWKWLVELARKSYERKAGLQDREIMLAEVKNFFVVVTSQIDQIWQRYQDDFPEGRI